jgi:hypothetical protein
MRQFGTLMTVALVSSLARLAVAQGPTESPKVLVTVDSGEEALTTRLCQEMEALGLTVVVGEDVLEGPAALETEAKRLDAIAAVRVLDTRSGTVEMTIIDRATGKTVQRRLVIATPSDPAAAELISVRTVELLRASLMELHSAHPARGDVPITTQVQAIAEVPKTALPAPKASRQLYGIGAQLGWVYASGWSPAAHVGVAGTAHFHRAWAAQLLLTLPLQSMERSGFAGTAKLDWTEVRVGVGRCVRFRHASADLFVGVDAAQLRLDADPGESYRSNPSDSMTYGGYAAIGVELPFYGGWAMRFEQLGAAQFRKTVIRFAGVESGEFGRPVGATSLGLRLEWP